MNTRFAALVMVAAAVAGCGSTTSSATVSSGPGSTPSAAPSTTLSGSPDPMKSQHGGIQPVTAPIRALPTHAATLLPRTAKPISLPWRFVRLLDGGRKVEIALQFGGCNAFSYVQVAQQSNAIQLTAWGTTPESGKAICPMFEAILTGTVTLSAPLGSRQLLHGPVSITSGLPQ